MLVEPDGTTGSYILFDKTTLTPIATVNQAGTQTIINGQGGVSFQSSVQLSPDAQKIITDVFSLKFSDLNNPNTKLTTNFTDSIVPETFFVKIASGDFVPVTVQLVNVPSGPPAAPPSGPGDKHRAHSRAAAGWRARRRRYRADRCDREPHARQRLRRVSYADINAGDTPSVKREVFDPFAYQNAQHADVTATLTAEQLAAITAVEVPLNVVQDPDGKNIGTATWTYSVADGAFDFLAAGETLTLTYMARVDNNFAPNNETTFVPFTITITGTNDKPTVASTRRRNHRADRHRQYGHRHRHRHGHLHRCRFDRPSGRQRGDLGHRSVPLLRCGRQRRHRDADAAATGGDPGRPGAADRGAGGGKFP